MVVEAQGADGELVAGAAARLEAQQLHHGRVGNAIKEIVSLINLYYCINQIVYQIYLEKNLE